MSKLLGDATAYGYAVSQGYTGAEEQFAADMARIATTASEAAASADAAAASERNAQASAEQAEQSAQSIEGDVERAEQAATTATNKATEAATSATTANGAAQTATGKASEASASATAAAQSALSAATSATNAAASATAAQTAQTAAETAQGKAEDAQAAAEAAAASIDPDTLVKKTELEDYAKIDGSYETMTVGNAEQLVATVGVDDSTPYNFRPSGGSADIGDRETVNAVVGGTVAWNQLVETNKKARTITPDGNTTFSYTGVGVNTTLNHVYLISADITYSGTKLPMRAYTQIGSNNYGTPSQDITAAGTNRYEWVAKRTATQGVVAQIGISNIASSAKLTSEDAWTYDNANIFDLTLLFGSTIADYIYNLEQANEGAGVAYFRKLFPKDYYEYNSGELLSVNTSRHKMVGFNAYNPSTGTAHVVGGNQYQITGAYTALSLDGETVTPDASGFFTPSANGTLTITGGNSTTTCVHLVWSVYRDGEYEPYQEWVYPLDSSLTLRGIPKLDASGNLYYDGDTYAPDGTVTRRYKEVDLESLNWGATSSYAGVYRASASLSDAVGGSRSTNTKAPIILSTTAFTNSLNVTDASTATAGLIGVAYNSLHVTFAVSKTADEVKTALNGIKMLYQLKNGKITTETATPYTQIQSVDDFGTEEYTDYACENGDRDVAIPAGHNTFYPANLRDKLQHLPDLASADGYYMIQQTNNEMSLVLFRIPQASGLADGTYTLKATVASGTPTYTWVSDTAESEG